MRKLWGLLVLIGLPLVIWGQRGPGGPPPSLVFQTLDTDHDGTISAAEMANAAVSLQKLDRNGDGKLTEEEVRPQKPRREGEAGSAMPPTTDDLVKTYMAFDKNGDGQLTRDEVPERMQGLFDRADSNHDGILTVEEIRKVAQLAVTTTMRPGEMKATSPMRTDPILVALDADSNGEISASEIAAAPIALKKLDKNGDGQITADEVRVNLGAGPGQPAGPGGPDRK